MIKNIIFDWSGVVSDNAKNMHNTVNDMFEKLGGKRISFDEFRKEYKAPYMLFYNKYFPNLTMADEQILYQECSQKYREQTEYPGMGKLLLKLKEENINLVLLTADPKETIFDDVKKFGLENIFEQIYPDAHDKTEAIEEIMEKHNYTPDETLFIGDTPNDSDAGKKVGAKTVLVTWGWCDLDRLKKASPDYIVDMPEKIEKIICRSLSSSF